MAEPRVLLWLVRGFGTAILHGATTAILAMIAKARPRPPPVAGRRSRSCPGCSPRSRSTRSTTTSSCRRSWPPAVLLVALPLLVVAVFDRSEQRDARVARHRPRQRPRDRRGDRLRPARCRRGSAATCARSRPASPARWWPTCCASCACRPSCRSARRACCSRARPASTRRSATTCARACPSCAISRPRSAAPAGSPSSRSCAESARDAWQVFLLEEAGGGKTA